MCPPQILIYSTTKPLGRCGLPLPSLVTVTLDSHEEIRSSCLTPEDLCVTRGTAPLGYQSPNAADAGFRQAGPHLWKRSKMMNLALLEPQQIAKGSAESDGLPRQMHPSPALCLVSRLMPKQKLLRGF